MLHNSNQVEFKSCAMLMGFHVVHQLGAPYFGDGFAIVQLEACAGALNDQLGDETTW